ncbi:MAG: hypothetical protein QY317_16095 [Candidatus Jettenia caeni]|nr:MAG: hypothetical protein QY317_16095 [Candidatus Jettenia caeni]
MKFEKIKIGVQYLEVHASIPLSLWIKLNGQEIPICFDGNRLTNRITASKEKYPEIDIILTESEKKHIEALYREEKTKPMAYIPGIGFVNPREITKEQNEIFGNLKNL